MQSFNSFSASISRYPSSRPSRTCTSILKGRYMATVSVATVTICLFAMNRAAISANPTDNVGKAIAEANKEFGTAFEKGDAAAVARMYTEQGRLLPPNHDFVSGRADIEEFWKDAMKTVKSVSLESSEVHAFGDTAYEVGKYVLRGMNQTTVDAGKYLVIWKKESNAWRIDRDCWNSSLTAQGP